MADPYLISPFCCLWLNNYQAVPQISIPIPMKVIHRKLQGRRDGSENLSIIETDQHINMHILHTSQYFYFWYHQGEFPCKSRLSITSFISKTLLIEFSIDTKRRHYIIITVFYSIWLK